MLRSHMWLISTVLDRTIYHHHRKFYWIALSETKPTFYPDKRNENSACIQEWEEKENTKEHVNTPTSVFSHTNLIRRKISSSSPEGNSKNCVNMSRKYTTFIDLFSWGEKYLNRSSGFFFREK